MGEHLLHTRGAGSIPASPTDVSDNFKMDPFYCGECGSKLLVDGVKTRSATGGLSLLTVKKLITWPAVTSEHDAPAWWKGETPAERAVGRRDLIIKTRKLRSSLELLLDDPKIRRIIKKRGYLPSIESDLYS